MFVRPLYVALASCVQAYRNCIDSGNAEWEVRHLDRAHALAREYLPSGSGFDCGSKLDMALSTGDKLVIRTEYHHMDEHGGYCGWSGYVVTVTPSFGGFNVDVVTYYSPSGEDLNDSSQLDYVADAFHDALDTEVNEYPADE